MEPIGLQEQNIEPNGSTYAVGSASVRIADDTARQVKSFKPFILFFCSLALLVIGLLGLAQPTGKIIADNPPSAQPTIARGTSNDLWADAVIGQPDFGTINNNETTDHKLYWVNGTIAYTDTEHPENNTLFIYDAGNNRILGVNIIETPVVKTTRRQFLR